MNDKNYLSLLELDRLENFVPIIPTNEEFVDSYRKGLYFISNKLLNKIVLDEIDNDTLVQDYVDNFNKFSKTFNISEIYSIYKNCKLILETIENPIDENDYTPDDFEYNGFIKSTFVIHEHDSKRAPLHWDLRWKTEFKTSAYSFVLLKHKMPETQEERLLVKQQPMHPTAWVDMVNTTIGEGYGQGSVKTIDRGTIYYKKKDKGYTFYLDGAIFKGAYHMINTKFSEFLLFKAKGSILANTDERNKEWIEYAKNFIEYINKTFKQRYKLSHDLISSRNIEITKNNEIYNPLDNYRKNNILYLPSIQMILELKKDNINKITSKEAKINNIEDIMRLLLLRNIIAPEFFNYFTKTTNNQNLISNIFDDIRDTPYTDEELEILKLTNYSNYIEQKVYRMFSDIYLGHKYYSQFDFERYLINYLLNKNNNVNSI